MEIAGILEKYKFMVQIVIKQFNIQNQDFREDVIQELNMHLFYLYKKNVFNQEIKNMDSYIFIALKRKAINVLKKEKREVHLSLNEKVNKSEYEYIDMLISPKNDDNENNIAYENIITYISFNFNPTDQKIIEMYFFKKMTYESIGQAFNLSRETIRRRLNKAIAKIRRWYK